MNENNWIKIGDTWINTGTGNLLKVSQQPDDDPFSGPVLKLYMRDNVVFWWPCKSSSAKALIQWLDEQARDVFAEYQMSLEKAKNEELTVGDDGELVEVE